MKLYYSPGACSMVVRMLLIQVDADFQAVRVDLTAGEQRGPDFLALNPKGKVPTLVRDDGSVLTELGTIAAWIGAAYPEHRLLPDDLEGRLRAQESIDYCVCTVHTLGIARIFAPSSFDDTGGIERIKARGREILERGIAIMEMRLSQHPYIANTLSIADFVFFWIVLAASYLQLPLPAGVERHYREMRELESVRQGLAAEGFQ